jgi:hypothetical protein
LKKIFVAGIRQKVFFFNQNFCGFIEYTKFIVLLAQFYRRIHQPLLGIRRENVQAVSALSIYVVKEKSA